MIHCVRDEITNFLSALSDAGATPRVVRVLELTTIANIKLNERHSLRRCKDRILITPDISRVAVAEQRSNISGRYENRLPFHDQKLPNEPKRTD